MIKYHVSTYNNNIGFHITSEDGFTDYGNIYITQPLDNEIYYLMITNLCYINFSLDDNFEYQGEHLTRQRAIEEALMLFNFFKKFIK